MTSRVESRGAQELRPPDELAHTDFEMVVRRLADDLAFGTDDSLFVGSGLEYAQSRAYEPGDPIKQIDWRVSAKLGKPFVKEYESLRRFSIYIVVDTSTSMSVASHAISKHDLAVWLAAALGLVAQRRLSPVAVMGGGERETRLLPSLLQSDLWQALEPLRVAATEERTQVGERVRTLESRIDRASLVFVLSDFHDPDAVSALRHAGQRHDVVALHLQDEAERGELRAGFFRGSEAETGRMFLAGGRSRWRVQPQIERELAGAGVSYLRLRPDQPFVPPLRHFLQTRALLMKGGR